MKMDRRNFIKKMGRNVIVGGVVIGGSYLLFKPETGVACNFEFICKDCRQLKSCTIDEAVVFKQETDTKIKE